MDLGLKGRRALVTGASKGLGKAVAAALSGFGAWIR
jgi:3-oxoacyl-[acyl-carrier protein] reductase